MNTTKSQKDILFSALLDSVHQCDLCQRMCGRRKVLSALNGNINSKVAFIAEAPGRLGAECTGIPLYGDKSGDNFELLLGNIGWLRSDIFVTNSILCNPQDESGNNSTPENGEIQNCSYYLKMTLELVDPDVVVTIGAKALDALNLIYPHNVSLKENVATLIDWNGKKLFPLYHTGPRAMVHRSIVSQRADFIKLSHIVDPNSGLKKPGPVPSKPSSNHQITPVIVDMVDAIVNFCRELSFFKLTKLMYLIDYSYYEKNGTTISGAVYLRMQEGPWIPFLKDITKMYNQKSYTTYFTGPKPYLISFDHEYSPQSLSETQIQQIHEICDRYSTTDDGMIKIAAYRTPPMQYILAQEKIGRQMTKVPVLYKDKTVIEMDKWSENRQLSLFD